MSAQYDISDLADAGQDFPVDEWALEEFDDLEGAAELHAVRLIAARQEADD